MQLTINHPSAWISASLFKPFLLIGVAGISSVALYTPLSSQAEALKAKVKQNAVAPVLPFVDKTFEGAGKLFGQLGNWAKAGANTTDAVKQWIANVAGGSVSNGAKEIYETLKTWGLKVYKFIESLFTKEAWERIKSNIKMLGNILNLFKNIMKAELNGNTSILNEIVGAAGQKGFDEFASAMGEMATERPDLLNDKVVKDLVNSFMESPEETTEAIKKFKDQPNSTPEQLMNAVEQSALVGRIKNALKKAEKYTTEEVIKPEEKADATKLFKELGELKGQLEKLIETEKAKVKK